MIGKFLVWFSLFLSLLLLAIYDVRLLWAGVLGGAVICIGIAEIWGVVKSWKAYSRDPEVSQIIGRMTCGIDHKGRPTHRIIW